MNHKPSDQELIDGYLRKELSKEEISLFEERMSDPEFKKHYEEQWMNMQAVSRAGKKKLKAKLQEIESTLPPHDGKKGFNPRLLWILVVLAIIFFLAWLTHKEDTPEVLYAEFYQPFQNIVDPITKGAGDEEKSITQLYELGEYQKVVNAYSEQKSSDTTRFYTALAMVALSNCESAQQMIRQINSANPNLVDIGNWYLSLCYLKIDDQKYQALFEEIAAEPSHPYHKEAQDLLERIQ